MPGRVTRSRASADGTGATTVKQRAASTTTPTTAAKAAPKRETPNTSRKRSAPAEQAQEERAKPSAKKARTAKASKTSRAQPDFDEAAKVASKIQAGSNGAQLAASSPSKKNSYNLTPGSSPYPSYERPTPQECHNVNDLLAAVHGKVAAPKTIPAPNLQSSGCGEVPSVLDALVRTRLSAATNGANSSRAFRGLVDKFGIIKDGIGKGSVDWDKVRRAPVKEVFEAIKTGGLADVKSRDIQKILSMVHEENQAGRDGAQPTGGKGGKTILSLDHLHGMSSEAAFDKLLGYPGIGPKTASCVLLFCMQRPSFAVDTHVFRLVSWLGWVPNDSAVRRMAKLAKANGQKPPPPATRNTTYAHLDVRIPDELKYSLHYLFIRHGKTCPGCSAKKDSKIREAWGDKKCPLAALKRGVSVKSAVDEAGDIDGGVKKEEDGDADNVKEEEEEEAVKEEDEDSE